MEIKVYGSITITGVKDGKNGDPGRGVVSETKLYYISASDKNPPEISDAAMASGYWKEAFPKDWTTSDYIWSTTKTEWTDGEITYAPDPPTLIGQIEAATTSAQLSGMSLADWCVSHNITIIDGSVITTGSISADKMAVKDLSAFEATIGGWTINSDSIFKDSVKLSTGNELYDSLIEGHPQSPLRISAGASSNQETVYETYTGAIPDYVEEPAHIKPEYDAGYGRLTAGACTTYYHEYVDNTTGYADGFTNERADVFTEYGYLPNNEGVMTLVLYKGDTIEYQEPDWREPFFYEGQVTIDGVTYDKWRKIVNLNAGGGQPDVYTWTSTEKQYAYTNVIAVDNSHVKQNFSIRHRAQHFHVKDVSVVSIDCQNQDVEMHIAENGVSWVNDVITVNLEIDNPKAAYSGMSFILEIQYTPADDAPFQVLEDGSLYAAAASIKGDVRATSGYIGGWQIRDDMLFKQDGNNITTGISASATPTAKIGLAPSPIRLFAGAPSAVRYTADDSQFMNVSIGYGVTKEFIIDVEQSGGKITAVEFDGFDSFDGGLTYKLGISEDNSQIILSVINNHSEGMADAVTNGTIYYWYSPVSESAFMVLDDGSLHASKAEIEGTIRSTSGHIGNVKLSGGGLSISQNNTESGIGSGNYDGDYDDPDDDNGVTIRNLYTLPSLLPNPPHQYSTVRFYAGATDQGIGIEHGSGNFAVLDDGSLYANSANIKGMITATGGSITGDLSITGSIGMQTSNSSPTKTYITEDRIHAPRFYGRLVCESYGEAAFAKNGLQTIYMPAASYSGDVTSDYAVSIGTSGIILYGISGTSTTIKKQIRWDDLFSLFS